MIAYLNGVLIWSDSKQLIINVQGVGYLVEVADSTIIPEIGDKAELFIYTYVREDRLHLYGFKDIESKELFTLLLSVSGIGPKAALNILSFLSPEKFIQSILTENVSALKQVSGIGVKTAQRLILELKNKVNDLSKGYSDISEKATKNDDIYEALQSLGYSYQEIDKVLSKIDFTPDLQLEERIKQVLNYLAKGRV